MQARKLPIRLERVSPELLTHKRLETLGCRELKYDVFLLSSLAPCMAGQT